MKDISSSFTINSCLPARTVKVECMNMILVRRDGLMVEFIERKLLVSPVGTAIG